MQTRAFTLVELSIVLVILGLLVGGVLAGQSLIRAAELRAVTNEFTSYQTAMNTFRDKYFAIPGDMRNATSYWGVAAGTTGDDSTCQNFRSTGQATCNGNGNGYTSQATINAERFEAFRIWQHLANAGLIEGQFSGVGNNAQAGCNPGVNCPRSRVGGGTWHMFWRGSTLNDGVYYDGNYDHVFLFGLGDGTTGENNAHTAVLKTDEAYNIDMKIDDGRPAMGIVRTYKKGSTASYVATTVNCANNATAASAQYDLARPGVSCSLIFMNGF